MACSAALGRPRPPEAVGGIGHNMGGRQAISQAVDAPLDILEAFLGEQGSEVTMRMTSTERKLIRISAATAFSYLIPSNLLKDPDSKTNFEKNTGTNFLLPSYPTSMFVGKLHDSKCLDLVISLISPGASREPEDSPSPTNPIRGSTSTVITKDIENAIQLELKEQKVQQREALKRTNIPLGVLALAVPWTSPAEPTLPESVNTAASKQPWAYIVDKAVTRKAQEEDKLRLHAFLAISTFVDHGDLRNTIVRRNVPEALVHLVEENSDNMSSAAAQALLHMLGSDDVAEYIVRKDLTTVIIDIALKKDTKLPVSAARILEELAKHDCTRRVIMESGVPKIV
ncbi:hypothetical protein FIBSPDRAFT_555794 [Athelia psychrophila]|uniref:ARM repeat-containing protein n=1 Tax=Athelia psychrophila TaxID=1759441 RepID=A0A166IIM6_9AGAM|nr:hypothetical protein FIBSPDRAFT_555794 [Fibularhizoctonia sp. CBS 109695]